MYALHRGGAVAATASAAAKNASSSRLPLSQVAMTRRALCLARLHSSTGPASEAMHRVRAEAAAGGARRRAAGVCAAPVWSRSARGMGSWTPAPGSPQERFGAAVVGELVVLALLLFFTLNTASARYLVLSVLVQLTRTRALSCTATDSCGGVLIATVLLTPEQGWMSSSARLGPGRAAASPWLCQRQST